MQILEMEMRKSWCLQHNKQGIWLAINTHLSSKYVCSGQGSLINYSHNTVFKANWLPFSVICKGWQGLTGKCHQVDDMKNAKDYPCPSTESQENPHYWLRCNKISKSQAPYTKIMDQPPEMQRKVGCIMHTLEHRNMQGMAYEEQSIKNQRKTELRR